MRHFLTHAYARNVLFPFVMAPAVILMGSVATGLFFGAAAYLIFMAYSGGVQKLLRDSLELMKRVKILWAPPIFYLWLVATALFANGPESVLEPIGSYLHFLVLVPMAIAMQQLSPDTNLLGIFSRGLRFALPAAMIVAAFNVIGQGGRAYGFFGNPLVFGTVCLTGSGLAVLCWREDTPFVRVIAIAACIAGILAAFLTASRGIAFAAVFVLGCLAVYFVKGAGLGFGKAKSAALITGALAILVGTLLAVTLTKPGQALLNNRFVAPVERFMKGEIPDTSIGRRLEMQLSGWAAFVDSPLTGHGMQNVVEAANSFSMDAVGHRTSYGYTHLHNDYLTHLVAGGIPLGILFVLVIVLPATIALRTPRHNFWRETAYSGVLLTVAFAAMAVTNIVLRQDQIMTFYSIVLVLILVQRLQAEKGFLQSRIPDFGPIYSGADPYGGLSIDEASSGLGEKPVKSP